MDKRVLFVLGTISGRGGIESALKQWFQALEQNGYTPTVVLLDRPHYTDWLDGFEHKILDIKVGKNAIQKLLALRKYEVGLLRVIRTFNPDWVIATTPFTVFLCQHCRKRRLNFRLASWIHWPMDRFPRKKLLAYADMHFAIGRGIRDDLVRHFPDKPVTLMPNFVKEAPDARIGTDDGRYGMTFIGRLEQEKRVDVAIRSLLRAEHWHLRIIGDGSLGCRLRELASQLGVEDRVSFMGWQDDPWESWAGQALVLTSDYEAMPFTILEALSRGIPVLATDCDFGPRELIVPGANGWLVPVGSYDALSSVLIDIELGRKRLPPPEDIRASIKEYSASFVVPKLLEVLESSITQV
ncbi:MAG: glycosyltransferase [Alicyclobacillus sp.]|nr:glycosyltransferase [Alicyclobacillus sp.]